MAERRRRTYSEMFLDALRDMSGGTQQLIGNRSLREALGWDEDRYDQIKWQLKEENQIVVGRGKGGTVGLAATNDADTLQVFISYSHADRDLKNELVKHLEPLRRQNLIEAWTDQEIHPGDEWDKAISEHLGAANIILLLVSIDFINSRYCYDTELDVAMEKHQNKQAVVVPIILRPCMWQHAPFAKLQALPAEAKAVTSWANRDEAHTNIAEGIRTVARGILGVA